MKAIVHDQLGPADSVLRLVDREIPEPASGEVRIRVAVSGVNPTDWKARTGLYGGGDPVESVPNQDGAGVIDAIGPDVDGFAVGDRVWVTLAAFQRPGSGTAQEYTVVPAEPGVPADGLPSSSARASASRRSPRTGPRPWPRMDRTRLAPGALEGKVILVAGGAGAVGHAAIQLARWAGATVIATTSPTKTAYATAAGAHHVVNYRDDDAADQIRTLRAGRRGPHRRGCRRRQPGPRPRGTAAARHDRDLRQRRRQAVRDRHPCRTWASTPATSSSCSTAWAGSS